jgi:small subunit ribosomal protein S20e
VEPEVAIYRIRITLTSHNVKSLEKVGADLIRGANEKNLKVKGLTKTLRFTTRKTPSGEASKMWEQFQMIIHSNSLTCTDLLRLLKRLLPSVLSQEWRSKSPLQMPKSIILLNLIN